MQMSAIATTGAQKRPWMLRKQTSASAPRDCLYMQQLEPKIGSRCYMGRHLQMQQRRQGLNKGRIPCSHVVLFSIFEAWIDESL